MLGPEDAIQFVCGEDTTPRQFYKQWLKKSGREIEMSERQTIHEPQAATPNGGPAEPFGNSGVGGGPPSVS
jgi:hypothetical protein